ncbi:MAG: DUF4373 domain-containing protein [bacterium]|nr:DUF4373 domain-containing protein [bacterium]
MQYYKHMSNMRNDVKLRRVINRYGLEGYGLYCLILESITESLTTQSPIPDLQETCADIAEFYNGDTTRVNEMVSFMLNNDLFELDDYTQRVVCNKLYKFLESNQTRSKQVREMIKAYKGTSNLPQIDVSQTVSDRCEEENRTEEKRTEENTDVSFEQFWDAYPKKTHRSLAANAFMLAANKAAIVTGARNYAEHVRADVTDKRFMINALNFISDGRFEEYQTAPKKTINQTTIKGWTCKCGKINTHSGGYCLECREDK